MMTVDPAGVHVSWVEDIEEGPHSYRNLLEKLSLTFIKHPDGTLEIGGDVAPLVREGVSKSCASRKCMGAGTTS
jgi:hypothetical protein